MNSLTVLKSTGLCSIQDLGRPHAQHLGFSSGGAADEYAFLAANFLLGNQINYAALEVTLGQIILKADCQCKIAITGADCQAQLNGKLVKNWQVLILEKHDILQLHLPREGLHSYIAVADGIVSTSWLNSQSQTLNELKLSFTGHALTSGSIIELNEGCFPLINCLKDSKQCNILPTKAQVFGRHFYQSEPLMLRFIPQVLWHKLSSQARDKFCSEPYIISSNSNRMAYRLSTQGNCNELVNIKGIGAKLSIPVNFGSVQLPSNGQPIVLMKERQTIGGYPVLGVVMQTDLFRLSQKRPGQKVQFLPVSLIQAQQQLLSFYQKFSNSS